MACVLRGALRPQWRRCVLASSTERVLKPSAKVHAFHRKQWQWELCLKPIDPEAKLNAALVG
jgi:hypothetical protein